MQTTRGTPLSGEGEKRAELAASRSGAGGGESAEPSATQMSSGEGEERAELTALPAGSRRRRVGILIGVALVVLALDVVSKLIVVATLSHREPVRLLGGFVKLEETRNAGAAFSIGTGATFVFAFVAIAVIVVISRTARRLYSGPWAIVLGMLLGGATGNLVDRLARSPGLFRGQVVDWIRLPHFAVFNLADSAITVGAVLAVLLAMAGRQIDGSVTTLGRGGAPADSTPPAEGQPASGHHSADADA